MSVKRPLKAVLLLFLLSAAALAQSSSMSLLESGRADEAIRTFNARIQQNPNDAEAYNLLARIYFQLERWDDSIRAAEKSVALQSQNSEYHQWLGRAYGEKADSLGRLHPLSAISLVRKTKAELEKAVSTDSTGKNLEARADLSEFYTEAPTIMGGDKTKARQLADYVLKYDPALAHYMYGRIEEQTNSKGKAEQEYKTAIQISGNLSRYWVALGSFYRRAGRLQEIEDAVNQSLKDPAWLGLAKEGYVFTAALFFVCCFAMSSYGRSFERRLNRHRAGVPGSLELHAQSPLEARDTPALEWLSHRLRGRKLIT